jgi:hypothetical protein
MSEPFDNLPVDKIRSIFENYREPFNEDAWGLMKQKLVARKKRTYVLFISIAKAASIILITGFLLLYPFRSGNSYLGGMNHKALTDSTKISRIHTPVTNTCAPIIQHYITHQDKNHNINGSAIDTLDSNLQLEEKEVIANFINDSLIHNPDHSYADLINTIDIDTSTMQADSDSILDKRPVLLPEDDFIIHKKSDKKFNVGIALTSYYGSSDIGATDNLSFGGGVQADYAITDFISVTSGVMLADHQFNTSGSNAFKGVLAESNDYDHAITGTSEKEIRLVGLDIPLNLSFRLDRFSITSGVSSLVYLKETYSEDYYVENEANVYNPQTGDYELMDMYEKVNTSDSKGAFQTFDFAKLINLSVGYFIPMKKGKLVLEPFAKIPIGDMTGYDISYGYGGILLRYEF